jgi:endoglucanase
MKSIMRFRLSFLLFLLCSSNAFSGGAPFTRGVNLTTWFEAPNARQIQFTKYTKRDLQNIKSLGADVIRLPINMHGMTSGAPAHTIDPLLFTMLDPVVDWAEELGLHLILDNHSFDPAVNTSPHVWSTHQPLWKQIAARYKERSALIYYEILNEPHGIDDLVWNTIQQMVIDSIRSIDTKHTIIIGPAGWNSYGNLNAMPFYADTNLIYTFHFYDPFIFTHQGASWSSPSLVPLAGVPFPYAAGAMPAVPPALVGTWIQNDINNYAANGTAAKVRQTLDIAVNFSKNRNVKLFCGEFGVYKPNSNNEDRVRWYQEVRSYLEQNGIAWTSWDYQGGFGLFQSGTSELFDHHLNVPLLGALGFTIPPQSPFVMRADTAAFVIMDDFVGAGILASHSGGEIDPYGNGQQLGNYCLRWKNAAQYQHLGFNFVPDKDLSLLKLRGYELTVRMKTTGTPVMLDLRFLDTKTGPLDHPWRMRTTVTVQPTDADDGWLTFRVPLAQFTEHGAWDSIWYNPVGAFDWKAVDRFEIVAEHGTLAGKEVLLDLVRIINTPVGVVRSVAGIPAAFELEQNFPNPFNPSTSIGFLVPVAGEVRIAVYDLLGRLVATPVDGIISAGRHSVQFNAGSLAAGTYLCVMRAGSFTATTKLSLLK